MGHHGGSFAQARKPRGMDQLFLEFMDTLLKMLALGKIADKSGKKPAAIAFCFAN